MKVDKRLFFIAPNWSQRLVKIRGVSGLRKKYITCNLAEMKMDMNDYGMCVVGEAYHFSSTYEQQQNGFSKNDKFCQMCASLASQFVASRGETTEEAIPRFEELIVDFCDHVEKDHHKHFPVLLAL